MGTKIAQEKIWAGTEQSLQAALDADESINARITAGNYSEQEREDTPRLLEVSDGVAVVSIKGSLNNDASFWNEVFGMTGYPEIRDAMLAAAQDPEVKQILLDIDSGGGAVSGVEDTAKLIRMVNDHVKPVTAFTDGTMASAAYWLGSAAGKVFSGKTAVVGSIGVISTHMERSQMLKEAGIGVTVIRAGKYKALANSVEPLSEEGRKQIQQIVDAVYGQFTDHVAAMRGRSTAFVDEHMAQGREFVGQTAVDIGLVDQITSFDALVSDLKEKAIDQSKISMDNRGKFSQKLSGETTSVLSGESEMGKKALTEKDIAALAAGAAIEASAEANAEADVQEANVEAAGEAAGAEESQAAAGTQVEAAVEAVAGATQKVDTINATVQLLNEQLKSKDEALVEAKVKLAQVEAKLAEAEATSEPLREIALKAVNNMRIACDRTVIAADIGAAELVAEYKTITEAFSSKFKAGGVAAVDAAASQDKPTQHDPRHMARVNAARFNSK